jgi:colicin import membrane protein
MHAAADRPEFAPPPQPGLVRAFVLAVLAHLLLLFALMHGLKWQRDAENVAAEAELWSSLPQQAAPKPVEATPPPPAPPAPAPAPPVVKAPPPPAPAPEPPAKREADIALEREKEKRELQKRRQAEAEERAREEQRKAEAQKKREQELARKKQQEELAKKKREEELARKEREEELARKKQEQAKQLAEAKRKEEDRKRKLQEQEARVAKQREENLRRIQSMAGTGAPSATGSAAQASGPSGAWAAKVIGKVRPNIVFSDSVSGNLETVVDVRLAPDGTIVSRRVTKSSGHAGWDAAVLRALDKTEVLPRDTDGSVPRAGALVFRPRG